MAKFQKGEDPVIALNAFKEFMQAKKDEMQKTTDPVAKAKIVKEALDEHHEKMGSLTTIFKGDKSERQNRKIDSLKKEIRALYDPIKAQQDEFDRLDILARKSASKAATSNKEELIVPVKEKEVQPSEVDIETRKVLERIIEQSARISNILKGLNNNIGHSSQHYSSEAIEMAKLVRDNLYRAWKDYSKDLHAIVVEAKTKGFDKHYDKNMFLRQIEVRGNQFKSSCDKIINEAMPTFKKDMELGDYLKNQVKKFINAVVKLATRNDVPKFFKTAKSTSAHAVKEAGKKLDPDYHDTEGKTPKP